MSDSNSSPTEASYCTVEAISGSDLEDRSATTEASTVGFAFPPPFVGKFLRREDFFEAIYIHGALFYDFWQRQRVINMDRSLETVLELNRSELMLVIPKLAYSGKAILHRVSEPIIPYDGVSCIN